MAMNFGYQPYGTTRQMLDAQDPNVRAMGENSAGMYRDNMIQANHERGLQQQEQQRRQYDSESQRQASAQKFGILGQLLGGRAGGMGGGQVMNTIHRGYR